MKLFLRRYQKLALVATALAGAILLTIFRAGHTGLAIRDAAEDEAVASGSAEDFRAFRLRILSQVIMLIHERYIEPERIDWRAMLLGGLDYIQQSVAEVLVRHEEGSDQITVQVNSASQTFSLADLDRPWALTFRFREIFLFIRANLQDENVDLRDIEYAACNGVLHTLDPHSILLDPELYEEMRMGTRGEFGGLGIVISIRDGQLTIISPIDGTPAAEAGLLSMDRIVMIGDETTINMTLEEAVDRLRGPPGTSVSIRVLRQGWNEPRPFEITRAIIRIESVESKLLPGGVGYVKIRSFQGNTVDDLVQQLGQLREQGMRSLVLDLRDDPGGLLDQAVRVADAFLSEGVIVTTAGNTPSEREVRTATAEPTDADYPIVVLVNSGSASASEIVAGALKGNNRALILGETTFGKGSVQVLYDFDDGSALKLTIAHYLTPGDVSIQSVGIVPDIEVLPLVVRRNRIDLVPDEISLRESNLESHLAGTPEANVERPLYSIRHYRVPQAQPQPGGQAPNGQAPSGQAPSGQTPSGQTPDGGTADGESEDGEEGDAGEDGGANETGEASGEGLTAEELLEDFEVRLAYDLLRRGDRGNRPELIERAATLVSSREETEESQLVDGLRGLGVDWTTGSDRGPTTLDVEVVARGQGDAGRVGEVDAGGRLELTVRVTNRGASPVYRLHALTRSDNPYFDQWELPLGHIDPGQTREWTVRIQVPRDSHTRIDPVRVEFTEQHGHAPETREVPVAIRGLTRPTFSYAVQVLDQQRGNGDGRVSRGERVRLFVTVSNQGPGQTYNSQVNIKNDSGEGVLIHDGRFVLGQMQRGESRTHAFEFEVLPSFEEGEVELELAITDIDLREEVNERLRFPLVDAGTGPRRTTGTVQAAARAPVFEYAAAEHRVGWLPAGATATVEAEEGGFLRVSLGDDRAGWVRHEDVAPAAAGVAAAPRFENQMDNTPPEITLSGEPPLQADGDHLTLRGVVTDADRVLDMYVFVGRRKVFYLSNRGGRDQHRLAFDATLPLEPGSNFVLVVARENSDVVARRIMIIRREGAGASAASGPPVARGPE
jgi:carboxyl-terminal processing protease